LQPKVTAFCNKGRAKGHPITRKIATRLAGMALIGFGIKLAINDR